MYTRALRSSRRGLPAFTLVELLTVVAIIGILVAVLAVSLPGYLQSGKKTVSASNLRNWYTGFSGALRENDGTMPHSGYLNQTFDEKDPDAWFNAMPRALGIPQMSEWITKDELRPSIGKASIWTNPVLTAKYNIGGQKYVFNYGYNELLRKESGNEQTALKLAALRYPEITILMSEKADVDPHLTIRNTMAFWGSGRPEFQGDLDNQANFLFCDGHVESVKRQIFGDQNLSTVDDAVRDRRTRITYNVVTE